jgi:hypothetical protein
MEGRVIDAAYTVLYWLHVPIALASLPLFWVAVLSRKGGPRHVRSGRWFALGMGWVAATGAAMAALVLVHPDVRVGPSDPAARRSFAAFLLYLAVITAFPVLHGVRVVRTRRDPRSLATARYRALAHVPLLASAAAVLVALLVPTGATTLLLGMSPIGVVETAVARRYLADPARHPRLWWPQHMTAMLIAGIAAHTAFAVFFLGSLLGIRPAGLLALAPWLTPTIVGVPVLVVWVRRESRRLLS